MNEEKDINVSVNSHYYTLLFKALFPLLGYFVYGGIKGALAILLLCIICDFTLFLSLIPFVGWLVQALVMRFAITKILALTCVSTTWLISTIFWVYLVFGIIISIASSLTLLMALDN